MKYIVHENNMFKISNKHVLNGHLWVLHSFTGSVENYESFKGFPFHSLGPWQFHLVLPSFHSWIFGTGFFLASHANKWQLADPSGHLEPGTAGTWNDPFSTERVKWKKRRRRNGAKMATPKRINIGRPAVSLKKKGNWMERVKCPLGFTPLSGNQFRKRNSVKKKPVTHRSFPSVESSELIFWFFELKCNSIIEQRNNSAWKWEKKNMQITAPSSAPRALSLTDLTPRQAHLHTVD